MIYKREIAFQMKKKTSAEFKKKIYTLLVILPALVRYYGTHQ